MKDKLDLAIWHSLSCPGTHAVLMNCNSLERKFEHESTWIDEEEPPRPPVDKSINNVHFVMILEAEPTASQQAFPELQSVGAVEELGV